MKFFAELLASYFEETAQELGVQVRHYRIAGHRITFQFAGESRVAEMTSAIGHLEARGDAGVPEGLVTSMWDGRRDPRNHLLRAYLFTLTNWWYDYTGHRGQLLDIHTEQLAANYHPGTETLSVVDLENKRAFYWKRNDAPMPYYEACSPFRSLLHSWMREQDSYFVHGAAVGFPSGGVMLVGKGGSGKSTSALACLESELSYAGDDYCVVKGNPAAGYTVHSLYCTAKLVEMQNLEAFPEIAGNVINWQRDPGEKVALSLYALQAKKLIDQFPLRAVLVPVITGAEDTRIVPCTAHEALMAIAPSSLSQLPASGKKDLQFLGHLARSLPCYRILLGTALPRIPERISELLRGELR